MKQLSPFLYIKRNIKSILITTIGVLIGVVGVYFLSIITDTTNKAIDISGMNI